MSQPKIIQRGMGIGVSDWRLARAVSIRGQLGVVSSTAIDVVLARTLQMGDCDGYVRRAMQHFPFEEIAGRVWDEYFIPGGKMPNQPFKPLPLHSIQSPRRLVGLRAEDNGRRQELPLREVRQWLP